MTTNHKLQKIAKDLQTKTSAVEIWKARAQKILDGANEVQKLLILDKSKYKSIRCPRRSGKSFSMTSLALHFGEANPNSRILVISLTLKSTKENYWTSAPGGIFAQNHLYGLGLTFNHTDLVWYHENGSRGRLAGAETKADIEYFRGAAAESDIIIIDECKSFAPGLLDELIRDVIKPGLMTRKGSLVMGGTPGSIPVGPFFLATQPGALDDNGVCHNVEYAGKSLSSHKWSLHSWTLQENTAKPWQWEEALKILQDEYGGNTNHPSWRREYLGQWVTDTDELVYAFAKMKASGKVTWIPDRTKNNPLGLPRDGGHWSLVMGLDFGYEDDCAIVLSAWSDQLQELRQVYDWKSPHLTIDQFAKEILLTIEQFGQPDVIIGDKGALGKMIVETINARHSLGILPAEKKDKYDHIEFLNSDIIAGRVKIIQGSELDHEMSALQWDLEKDKKLLIRTGKLREDPSCPNHLCDAFLYSWRYCYHHWSRKPETGIEKGTPEWWRNKEKEELEKYKARLARESNNDQDFFSKRFKELKSNEFREY